MRFFLLALSLNLFLVGSSLAATWRVPDDAGTLVAAIDSATVGDTVLVAPGSYSGATFQGKDIVVISESGPTVTVISQVRFWDGEGPSAVLSGFTIRPTAFPHLAVECDGTSPTLENNIFVRVDLFRSTGVQVKGGGTPTIRNNRFVEMRKGVIVIGASNGVVIEGNRFERSADNDILADFALGSSFTIRGNEFVNQDENGGPPFGGAINIAGADCIIENNLFLNNEGWPGTDILYSQGAATVSNNTFVGSKGTAIMFGAFADVTFERNIVAYARLDAVFCAADATVRMGCNDFYANGGGVPVCQVDLGGNFSSDPLFCGIGAENTYAIASGSPCAPANNSCGVLIGAFGPVGCTPTDVPTPTVGTRLLPNHPNPFNPNTTIAYEVAAGVGPVEVSILDVRGRLVRVFRHESPRPGRNTVVWDGRDRHGRAVASGIYVYRMVVAGQRFERKMALVR